MLGNVQERRRFKRRHDPPTSRRNRVVSNEHTHPGWEKSQILASSPVHEMVPFARHS